jgi:hypothetical protein
MKNKFCILILTQFFFSIALNAQVSFSPVQLSTGRQLEGLWDIQIRNSGAAIIKGNAQVTLMEENSGNSILVIQVRNVAIPPGAIFLRQFRQGAEFFYSENEAGRVANITGELIPGTYQVCIRFESEDKQNLPLEKEYCFVTYILNRNPLFLVTPLDSICQTRPAFFWQGQKSIKSGSHFKVICAELKEGQSPEEALLNNHLFINQVINHQGNQIPFPAGIRPLNPDQNYAWQVMEITGKSVVNISEAGRFSVACQKENKDENQVSFAEVKALHSGKKYFFKDALLFSFHNSYNKGKLRYTITHVPTQSKLNNLPEIPIVNGVNQVTLPVSSINGLQKNTEYRLQVYNISSATYFIHFIIKE